MEVAVLSARLEADIAALSRNLAAADTLLAATRRQAEELEARLKDVKVPAAAAAETLANVEAEKRALARLEESARVVESCLEDVKVPMSAAAATVAATEIEKRALKQLEDQAIKTRVAVAAPRRVLGPFGDDRLGSNVYSGPSGIFHESDRGRDGFFGRLFGARAADRESQRVADEVARMAGGGGGGGGGGGRNNVFGPDIFAGALPGGARARPAAILTALGLGIMATPSGAVAAAGVGLGATAGVMALVGGAATLAAAFRGLDKAAFTTQKGFEALTPAQQNFVMTLRELDAGLGARLQNIAQETVLPGVTAGIRAAASPALTHALVGGTRAFGGAISGGARQFGRMVGGGDFAGNLGAVLRADARYLRDMIDGVTHLTSAFMRLMRAAIPLTDWMDRGLLNFARWIDSSSRAAQQTGRLARFMGDARRAMQAWGRAMGGLGNLLGAVLGAVGLNNSIRLMNTLGRLLNTIAAALNRNRGLFRAFFAGGLGAANDLISVLQRILRGLQPVLNILRTLNATIRTLTGGVNGFRIALDAVAVILAGRFLRSFTMARAEMATTGATAAATAANVSKLRIALLGIIAVPAITSTVVDAWKSIFGDSATKGLTPTIGGRHGSPFGMGTGLNTLYQQAFQAGLSGRSTEFRDQFLAENPDATAAMRSAVLRGTNAGAAAITQGAGGGAISSGLALPRRLQNQMLAAQNMLDPSRAQRAMLAVDRGAVAYYDELLQRGGLNADQRRQILQARAPYAQALAADASGKAVSAFSTPDPLQGTGKAGVLPVELEQAIAIAESNVAAGGPKAPLLAAINAAIGWIDKNVGGIKDRTLATTYYQERTSLYNELAGLKDPATRRRARTGLALLPAGMVTRLTAAQQRVAGIGGAGAGADGVFTASEIRAEVGLVTQLRAAQENLSHQKNTLAVEKERVTIAHQLAAAEKKLADMRKENRQHAEAERRDRILGPARRAVERAQARMAGLGGIGPGTPFSRERLQAAIGLSVQLEHELEVLRTIHGTEKQRVQVAKQLAAAQADVREQLMAQEQTRFDVRMERMLGIHGGVPGLASIRRRLRQADEHVTELRGRGASIPRATLNSLRLIHRVLVASQKEHKELNDSVKENLAARLTQINDTLKGTHTGGRALTRLPSVGQLMRGLHGSPETRRILAERLVEVAALGGHVPTGPSAFGIPLAGRGHSGHTVINGPININLTHHGSDAAQLARNLRSELTKTARRNATQTRGPNAGRNVGHN